MGFLKDLVGIAAPIAGTFLGGPAGGALGGLLGGAVSGSGQPKSTTSTQQQKLDPRIEQMLFGSGGQQGLLGQYQSLLNQPRSAGAQSFANANEDFLGRNGLNDLNGVRNAAYQSMAGNSAPQAQASQAQSYTMQPMQAQGAQAATAGGVQAGLSPLTPGVQAGRSTLHQISDPAWAKGSNVQAPGQNNIDLTGSYNSLLGGGDTSKLMASLQAGNALTSAQQQQNQSNMTDNLLRNVLPATRGGAIAAGQYGGSRQGIAEGNAISDFTKQLNQSNTQIGLANSANTAGALAGAYENGQSRALSATQGLGAQQYGVASQDAATRNQAEFMNVNNANDILKTNTGIRQQNEQFNAGLYQQAGQFNANQFQQNNQFNAGQQQAANTYNSGQQQQNNQFNAGLAQQTGQFNANLGQQAGQFNAGQQQQNSQFNAGLGQQTSLANLQSQLTTNAQNNSSLLGGAGLLSGLLGQVQGTVNQSDNWGLTRAQGVNSLLAPYLGANQSTSRTDPLYSNTVGNAVAGLGLGPQLGGLLGGNDSSAKPLDGLMKYFNFGPGVIG